MHAIPIAAVFIDLSDLNRPIHTRQNLSIIAFLTSFLVSCQPDLIRGNSYLLSSCLPCIFSFSWRASLLHRKMCLLFLGQPALLHPYPICLFILPGERDGSLVMTKRRQESQLELILSSRKAVEQQHNLATHAALATQ